MRDPLQRDASPYEVLGVPRAATPEEIDRGFKAGLVQRQNVPRLTAAKRALQDPVDRALVDAFLYEPAHLAKVSPNPLTDPAALEPARRNDTEHAWLTQLRADFPDARLIQSLAVLWYWNAVTLVDPDPTAARLAWEDAIAGWATLLASPTGWPTLPAEQRSAWRAKVAERLRGQLRDALHASMERGARELAAVYEELETTLESELKIAERLASMRFRTPAGPISCGRLLLGRLGLLDWLVGLVDQALQQNPGQPALAALRSAFSPLFRVEALLDGNDPEAAIAYLEGLPEGHRSAATARALRVRALRALGRRHADLEQPFEALKLWAQALQLGGGLENELKEDIAGVCLAAASAWQASRRDDAVKVLEGGLRATGSPRLQETLAELLTLRGIETANQALGGPSDASPKPLGPELLAKLRVALKDLETALRFGSRRAEEQARIVRSIMLGERWHARRAGRSVEFDALTPELRRRIVDCASGKLEPKPLFMQAEASIGCLLVAAALAIGFFLFLVLAAGFGEPAGAFQGPGTIALYGLALFFLYSSCLALIHDRFRRRVLPFAPGHYLFPLDVVQASGTRLRVFPLRDSGALDIVHQHNNGRYQHTAFTLHLGEKENLVLKIGPRTKADAVIQALQEARQKEADALRVANWETLRGLDPLAESR